jgi:hypothetical protein
MDTVVRVIPPKGRGVFATRHFARGEVVVVGRPLSQSAERTWQTMQVDVDKHVRMDEPLELTNHSCDPNCGLRPNEWGGYNLVALRPIAAGEEVTFDYAMSEWISIAVPECQCGSPICRGRVAGGKFLSPELRQKYAGFLAPYYADLATSG